MTRLISLVLVSLAWTVAAGDALEGHWEGAVSRFGAVQAVQLDIAEHSDSFDARYSIPDLGLYDEPAGLTRSGDTLRLHLWYGDFAMLLHDDVYEMTGTNTNWQPSVSLHLKRMPAGRGYSVSTVDFESSAGMLHGRLYRPRGSGPHPGVVVVAGSGEQGMDDWMYRSWGNILASYGYATLVYDKRGVGRSDGDLSGATFDDLSIDAVAAVTTLRSHPGVDSSRIGIMGISQGGWIVPLATRTVAPLFVILLVAPAVDVFTQEMHRIEFGMRESGYAETDISGAQEVASSLFQVAGGAQPYEAYVATTDRYRAADWFDEYFGEYTHIDSILQWRRERYDPRPDLSQLGCPTLVIYGESDLLVPPSRNRDLMHRCLSDAPTDDFRIDVIDGVGHDLMTGQSLVGTEWDWPSQFWRWNRRPYQLYESIYSFLDGTVAKR